MWEARAATSCCPVPAVSWAGRWLRTWAEDCAGPGLVAAAVADGVVAGVENGVAAVASGGGQTVPFVAVAAGVVGVGGVDVVDVGVAVVAAGGDQPAAAAVTVRHSASQSPQNHSASQIPLNHSASQIPLHYSASQIPPSVQVRRLPAGTPKAGGQSQGLRQKRP